MATTVNVICYKSKTLSNGEHPIMVRISKDGKRKYVSVGISVKSEFWNFNKNEPKLNCPNREYINLIIANKKKEYEEEIIRLTSENKDFTANTLGENKGIKLQTVNKIFLEYIDYLKMEKRTGYMKSVQQVYNSLLEYHGHLNIHFSEINQLWLKRYEVWLHNKGLANNTVGIRFRTLRAIFNYAITKEVARREDYPFDKYKVSKLNEETAKHALSKTDITRIIRFKSSNRLLQFPIDIFAFTYYAGGINFVDIANLTRANLMEDRLVYKRQKTGKLIRVPLTQKELAIETGLDFAEYKVTEYTKNHISYRGFYSDEWTAEFVEMPSEEFFNTIDSLSRIVDSKWSLVHGEIYSFSQGIEYERNSDFCHSLQINLKPDSKTFHIYFGGMQF